MPAKPKATRRLVAGGVGIAAVAVLALVAWPHLTQTPKPRPQVGPTLVAYVRSLGYRPLQIPRDQWGPGTLITLDNGEERIVRFNDGCLHLKVPQVMAKATPTPDVGVAQISLPQVSLDYGRSRSAAGDVELEKALDARLQVRGAFDDTQVGQIVVSIGDAEQFVAPEGVVRDQAKWVGTRGLSCTGDLADSKTYVIYDVLVIGDSQIGFLGKDGARLKLNAKLMKKIGADENLTSSQEGRSALKIPAHRIVGYKVMQVGIHNGLAQSQVSVEKLSLQDLDRLVEQSAGAH